jgi:hypothetical protein
VRSRGGSLVRNMLRRCGPKETTDERRLTKEVYEANLNGKARGKHRRTFLDQIDQVLKRSWTRFTNTARVYEEFDESRNETGL